MRTKIDIDLDEAQRDYLATLLDGKVTKRQVTRVEICNLVHQFIGAITAQAEYKGGKADSVELTRDRPSPAIARRSLTELQDLYTVAPEDAQFLKGKDASYVRGWNQVKRARNK